MSHESAFTDEWRECLREHYRHVIRQQDHVTEPSLHQVLIKVGFTESDLEALKVEALSSLVDEPPAHL